MRGLKHDKLTDCESKLESHPTWVRGLKLKIMQLLPFLLQVAPYVGAWIETRGAGLCEAPRCVAPYVGAWIETGLQALSTSLPKSHPTWVRGLKHTFYNRCPG